MLYTIQETLIQVNSINFPDCDEGDTVWLNDYEFLYENSIWVYNEKYKDPESNEILSGTP